MSTLRCWFLDGLNTHHPEPIRFYPEHGKPLCEPCERFYATQKAKRVHPAGKGTPALRKPDMTRCLHHDRDDRYSCPECIQNYEDNHTVSGVEVYFND